MSTAPDPRGRRTGASTAPQERRREPDTEAWNARYHLLPDGERRPAIVDALAAGATPELAWRNELGGQTWRIGDRYLKWSPRSVGVDLGREAERMRWLADRFPAPRVLEAGDEEGAQWLLTAALPGESAVVASWRADPERPVRAIAEGLRRLHAIPVHDAPGWESWVTRTPPALGQRPPIERPVLVHGDACSPNTLVNRRGDFVAIVDVGDLAAGDRWADLAVASMSLEWNYGAGWEPLFYASYGVEPDPERIRYYRALWDAES